MQTIMRCNVVHLYFCSLHPFPTKLHDLDGRERWKQAIKRTDDHKPWLLLEPTVAMRVCSRHFVDGLPTPQNPDPTLHLEPSHKARRLCERLESVDLVK